MRPEGSQNPAIVLDMGVNGLGVVRSLGREGIRVTGVVFAEQGVSVARYSRYCHPVSLSNIRDGWDEFLSRLVNLCRRMPAPPVLFPTSDESLAFLATHQEELASSALFVMPPRQTMLDILNKDRTSRIAAECGIRIPVTHTPSSLEQLCELAAGMRYPVLYKPRNHYDVCLPGGAKNFVFRAPDELKTFFRAHPHLASEGVCQEIIYGGDGHILVCAGYFNRDSEALALYTGRKIRQLQPDYGVTSYGVSEDLPEIAESTRCFLKKIGYRGLVAVEYVQERATGQVYFIEINGRSYYHNSLFLSCGINLPWIAYLDAVRDPLLAREVMPRQTYGIRWIDLARDARSFFQKHEAGQLGWWPWLRSLGEARSFAVYARDDLRPFLYGATRLLGRQLRKLIGRARTGNRARRREPMLHRSASGGGHYVHSNTR